MRLSTKGRYALNALIDIALNEDDRPIPLSDIAKRQEMSFLTFVCFQYYS